MEGEEYIALNPDSFAENEYWTYRNLQQLCMKLSLGGRGTKEELIMKLTMWHRERERFEDVYPDLYPLKSVEQEKDEERQWQSQEDENKYYFPMNVNGNNFSLLQIQINEIPDSSKKRKSSLVFRENQTTTCLVDPTLLRPIRQRLGEPEDREQIETESEGREENERKKNKVLETPTKGILKKSVMKAVEEKEEKPWGEGLWSGFNRRLAEQQQEQDTELGQENIAFSNTTPLRISSPSLVTPTKPRHSKLQFSPFNGIKIISHRYSSLPDPSPRLTLGPYHQHPI
jgi:hypothetical protein